MRSARKHLGWYAQHLPAGYLLRRRVNQITTCETQLEAVETYFDAWATDSLDALGMEWQPLVAAQ